MGDEDDNHNEIYQANASNDGKENQTIQNQLTTGDDAISSSSSVSTQIITTTSNRVLLCNASASALASIISRLCTHPFDTIKARIQVQHPTKQYIDSSNLVTKPLLQPPPSPLQLHRIRNMWSSPLLWTHTSRYIQSLYRGLGVVIIGGTPGTMLYLCTYDIIKQQLQSYYHQTMWTLPTSISPSNETIHQLTIRHTNIDFIIHFVSGMIAETVACIVYVPVDVIKERMQIQPSLLSSPQQQNNNYHYNYYYRNTYDAIRQIIQTEGIRGIYRGYGATLASFGPFSALYFVFYEYFKHSIHTTLLSSSSSPVLKSLSHNNHYYVEIPFHWTVICAATAGGLASFVTSPLDMAKLRLQVQRAGNNIPKNPIHPSTTSRTSGTPIAVTVNTSIRVHQYTGMMDCLQKVYCQYGIFGLFRGAGARVLHFAPATTVTMTTYETLRQHLWNYM